MKVSTNFGGTHTKDVQESVAFAVEVEKLGVDVIWCAEAWGMDCVAPLAYVAARTSRVQLGTGIMQISARRPSMIAMTALTLAALSNNRFILGLGASGPQVVEGLHGVPFDRPVTRLRETIEIARLAFRGEPLRYQGEMFQLPLPTEEAKALRLNQEPNEDIPIYLASLSPKSLRLTGEMADGWLGTSFVPRGAHLMLQHIEEGARAAGRSLSDVDIQVGGACQFGDDLERMIPARKQRLAFSMGAMGSRKHNFYNAGYQRVGYAGVAKEVQALWLAGKHAEAAARVPDEMVFETNFIGPPAMVREQFRAYRDAGVTTIRVFAEGSSFQERLDTLGQAVELIHSLDRETQPATTGPAR